MININEKDLCSGCGACYSICPTKSIEMKMDIEGFLYPLINHETCTECDICSTICPFLNPKKTSLDMEVFACKNKNITIRKTSSSGGIFTLVAEHVLKHNGIVCGAGFDENFEVKHIVVDDVDNLQKLRGSKYVQSFIGDVFSVLNDKVKAGQLVIFSGTPCQVSGLKRYLGKDYDNLICIDFICHGVPSPEVWRRYIQYLQKQYESPLNYVFFRDKKLGWKNFSLVMGFTNGKEYRKNLKQDWYLRGFLANLFLRPSCHKCKCKNGFRLSDITLADYWDIDSICRDFNDDLGVSLIIINNDKGKKVFSDIQNNMEFKVSSYEHAKYNYCLENSVMAHKNREKFFNHLDKNTDIDNLIKKYLPISFLARIKRKIYNNLYNWTCKN